MTIEQEIRLLEEDQKELAVTLGSLGLSIVGLLTGFGEAADLANAALFYSTGHPVLGTISGLSALPIPIVEQALGLTVGSCLLVKVLWLGAKILKSAVVIVTKSKILKPAIAFVKRTGHFFQFALDKGKICFKQLAYTLTHSNMKPGYVNLGAEVTVSGSKVLFQKMLDSFKKIADYFCKKWVNIPTKPLSSFPSKSNINASTKIPKSNSNSIFEQAKTQSDINKGINRYYQDQRNGYFGGYPRRSGGGGGMKI